MAPRLTVLAPHAKPFACELTRGSLVLASACSAHESAETLERTVPRDPGLPGSPDSAHDAGAVGPNAFEQTSSDQSRVRVRAYGAETCVALPCGVALRVEWASAGKMFASDDDTGILALPASTLPLDVTQSEQGVVVHVRASGASTTFSVLRDGALAFAREGGAHFSAGTPSVQNARILQRFTGTVGDHFAGLGHGFYGRVPRLDLAGTTVTRSYGREQSDQSSLIVPFFVSSERFGVFANTTRTATFHFGDAEGHGFDFEDPRGLDYFVVLGDGLGDLLEAYTRVTGRPRLPPRGMFGLALSDKGAPTESSEAWWRAKIATHRAAGFSLDHLINDNRWRASGGDRCVSELAWENTRYPDPDAWARWVHAEGMKLTLDFNRCIAEEARACSRDNARDVHFWTALEWFSSSIGENYQSPRRSVSLDQKTRRSCCRRAARP